MASRADQLNVFANFGQPTATSERVGNPRRVVEASVDTPGVSAGPEVRGVHVGGGAAATGVLVTPRMPQPTPSGQPAADVSAPLPPTFAQLRAEQRGGEVAIFDQESEAA